MERTVVLSVVTIAVLLVGPTSGYHSDDYDDAELFQQENSYSGTHSNVKTFPRNEDNRKPIFTNCSSYSPSIKEEQKRGLFVIQVHATDNDSPENGGTITYSIIKRDGDRSYFNIDNKTGVITTNLVNEFDRDEPVRLKEIYITVQATDNGRPVLADICTFKVTILDINDNAPSIDKFEYEEKVSEELTVDREVMRVVAYDMDDGDNAKLTYKIRSEHTEAGREFDRVFYINNETGVLFLKEPFNRNINYVFTSTVVVNDNPHNPDERKESTASIKITVVSSDKRRPKLLEFKNKIVLKENHNDFKNPIVVLNAVSNIPHEEEVIFEIKRGQTTQTNKDWTFIMDQNSTRAMIKLGRALDYETVTEYQLNVEVKNKDSWSVTETIEITIEDVNDEIPAFIDLVTGSVLENEDPGAEVMQVRAVDKDGTTANNIVSYDLVDHTDFFAIDPHNGKVTTKVSFDREKQSVYNIKIKAKDNSPSALTGADCNLSHQTFRVTIEDRNDNKPHFTSNQYTAERIPENLDVGKDVVEVKANDEDTASLIFYKIIDGNIGDAFMIENTTGRIKVNKQLDFEEIESYTLTIEANDGIYNDTAFVHIEILNINDQLPEFEPYQKNITILEESIPDNCTIILKAYDPDIKDRSADQKIVYRVGEVQKSFLTVDRDGCVKLTKKLDRDKPHGYPIQQVHIYAYDDNDSPSSNKNTAEFFIVLEDINDNAPFLNVTEVVWYENQLPGIITTLKADDYDGPENGPPFTFEIDDSIPEDVRPLFFVRNNDLYANVTFDREQRKYYQIPIKITDSGSPRMSGVDTLMVIIGDVNDNPAQPGSSTLKVYNYYKDLTVNVGRVFVEDPDDWDLDDKLFRWQTPNSYFELDEENGDIKLRPHTPVGTYDLRFVVTEEHEPEIPRHDVEANVLVIVKDLPEEAVQKSGSVRIQGCTKEEFVEKLNGQLSKMELMQKELSRIFNTSYDNVDIITIIEKDNAIDVRFSAHGSPYYAAEKLNSKVGTNSKALEDLLGVEFVMINIDECLEETTCEGSCVNYLDIKGTPAVVYTNKTSFVGVNAVVEAVCECREPKKNCLYDGVLHEGAICDCSEGSEGPFCEKLGIGFDGNGWALYPPFSACENSIIRLEVEPKQPNGLIFYVGPFTSYPPAPVRDFMSLELKDGYPRLLLDYGSGTTEVILKTRKLTDGARHSVQIELQENVIQLSIDDCHQSNCQVLKEPKRPNSLLNVNGPLQVGGIKENIRVIADNLHWEFTPTPLGFHGCIRNLSVNGNFYDLGEPSESLNAGPNCNYGVARAVSFGIDSNFLVAILVCIAILLILLLAVVVHRRKQDNWGEKDTDDIRETIISYEDEGGGEGDTGFDLDVLRRVNDDVYNEYPKEKAPEVPDISGFLDHKKDVCDRDANSYPFDDVRYYAYEGDGNSTGSLSSLASCTDDGDLKFNYLSSFGPRFRKLADMYGEDPSDDDSQDGGEESWC